MPEDFTSSGFLKVNVTRETNGLPISGARISISLSADPLQIIEETSTDSFGQTESISLSAPPIEYSMSAPTMEEISEGLRKPYTEYKINVSAPGFESVSINGAEILPDVTALQNVSLLPLEETPDSETTSENFFIPEHTLYGDYPPKIFEDEIKPISQSSEIVLSSVVIPEYVVVHDGVPSDSSAKNYYVRYRDYIKNVASSEIYATWPEATIIANILAIQSFTLNRVYTEWYRNRGYEFTITSSTAYDHKFIPERNIFTEIDEIVDEVFSNYLSRPNVRQPVLTQYCDGKNVTCPGSMSQWGSKYLGDQGYTAINILRNYYGSDIYINQTYEISGVPSSWPGYTLQTGSSGEAVRTIQEQLNTIRTGYPLIPQLVTDGIYGSSTANAVRVFQSIFGPAETGTVDFSTWFKISQIYVAVSRIAEQN